MTAILKKLYNKYRLMAAWTNKFPSVGNFTAWSVQSERWHAFAGCRMWSSMLALHILLTSPHMLLTQGVYMCVKLCQGGWGEGVDQWTDATATHLRLRLAPLNSLQWLCLDIRKEIWSVSSLPDTARSIVVMVFFEYIWYTCVYTVYDAALWCRLVERGKFPLNIFWYLDHKTINP